MEGCIFFFSVAMIIVIIVLSSIYAYANWLYEDEYGDYEDDYFVATNELYDDDATH